MTDPTQASYFWFTGASVEELARRLAVIGADKARLEVHPIGGKCYLRVKHADPTDAAAAMIQPDINDSWLCPPAC